MSKFWTYFKKIIFIWGIISLLFFLFTIVSLIIIPRITSHKSVEQDDTGYNKTFDDIRLKIIHRSTEQTNNIFINVTKSDKPLVSDYKLPLEQYDLDWIEITDATVIPVNGDEYRIILYSSVYDCDQESANYIWLLKLNKQITTTHMIALSDIHKIEDKEILMFGNKIINIPYFKNFKHEQLVVPIEIKISDSIKIVPMLNQKSIKMMKSYFENEMQKRIDNIEATSDTSMIERYKKVSKEFNETISEKVIPY